MRISSWTAAKEGRGSFDLNEAPAPKNIGMQ